MKFKFMNTQQVLGLEAEAGTGQQLLVTDVLVIKISC